MHHSLLPTCNMPFLTKNHRRLIQNAPAALPGHFQAQSSYAPQQGVGSSCSIEHIFNEDAVARGGIVYKDVGDGADQLTILNDGTSGHG